MKLKLRSEFQNRNHYYILLSSNNLVKY